MLLGPAGAVRRLFVQPCLIIAVLRFCQHCQLLSTRENKNSHLPSLDKLHSRSDSDTHVRTLVCDVGLRLSWGRGIVVKRDDAYAALRFC